LISINFVRGVSVAKTKKSRLSTTKHSQLRQKSRNCLDVATIKLRLGATLNAYWASRQSLAFWCQDGVPAFCAAPAPSTWDNMSIELTLNGRRVSFAGDPSMPLLWYLRDYARLTGTKFGCGVGYCGACTVHLDGTAARACITPVSVVVGRAVTTIEGLAHGRKLHPVQQAWLEEDVAQCGYCQAGQIMAAADLLRRKPDPSDADLVTLTNLCRCGTYPRIRKAIRRAAAALKAGETQEEAPAERP
jgi:isoquinoline 1-oxidoreductase alpha subunit